jgi:DNA polymerase I
LIKNNSKKKLFLIDGMALIYRAHFAMIKNPLITSTGNHTSAIHGFFNSIFKLLRDEAPEYFAVILDCKEPTFRHKMYKEYKANRPKMPVELSEQIQPILDFLDAANFPMIRLPGYEADDIIGTISENTRSYEIDTYIVSGDKDLMQLINESTFVYSPGNRFKPTTIYDEKKVIEKWGIPPEKIKEFLALMGDTSDNIPGVEGVGKKTASKLLIEYKNIDSIFENAESVKNKRVSAGLISAREYYKTSLKLVTIDTQVPINYEIESFLRKPANSKQLVELISQYELFSLQKQVDILLIGKEEKAETKKVNKNYKLIKSIDELKFICEKIKKSSLIAIDTETTSINPHSAKLVGISLSDMENTGFYIPILGLESKQLLKIEPVIEVLNPILADKLIRKCGQNIKYDVIVLNNAGFELNGIYFDTMIGAHLMNTAIHEYNLDFLAQQYLGYSMMPISELIGEGKNQITMDEVSIEKTSYYASEDADITFTLARKFESILKDDKVLEYYNKIDNPLIPVLVEMEHQGVFVDCNFLKKLSNELEEKLENSISEIYDMAGREFNINSPKQLSEILFDELKLKTIRKRSTDVRVLEVLKNYHPLPEKILEYRQYKKLKSTYVDALPEFVNDKTNRIHTSWNQTIAGTGRLSSTKPNFQNIPIRTELGKEVRKAIKAEKKGWQLLSADYSQIELRIMAHLSEESVLIEAFNNGDDIHAKTASLVFNTNVNQITEDQRRTAKVVNFGIMYGAGPFRMSQELGISMPKARDLINNYFNTYPGIRNYIDITIASAKENGFVSTIHGRKRKTRFLNSGNRQQAQAESRAIINMPIQGSASELIKLAMINIHSRLKSEKLNSKMILQVHDELIFEFPEEEKNQLQDIVVFEMENAMKLKVPLKVDVGIGKHWYEAH